MRDDDDERQRQDKNLRMNHANKQYSKTVLHSPVPNLDKGDLDIKTKEDLFLDNDKVVFTDEVSGSSFDWVKGVAEVPITFLFELRDVGRFGFLLPTDQIIPNNEEIMACLVEMDRSTRMLNYYSYSGSGSVLASIMYLVMSIGFLVLLK